MNKEARLERILGRDDLPAFFRELADLLESGGQGVPPLAGFRKMKISIEEKQGVVEVSVKAKPAGRTVPRARSAGAGQLPYKELKKRMMVAYKTIFSMVHQDRLPPKEAVDRFLEDSMLMTAYPGHGESYYREYEEACRAFALAYEKGDMAGLHQAFDHLDQVRSHCHNRYK
jgi:XXXCH domain-containing protein